MLSDSGSSGGSDPDSFQENLHLIWPRVIKGSDNGWKIDDKQNYNYLVVIKLKPINKDIIPIFLKIT